MSGVREFSTKVQGNCIFWFKNLAPPVENPSNLPPKTLPATYHLSQLKITT
ncbi:MAG: hypothetical protein F6K31_39455 [Symploca sp. SIO2G7]|nr:hypothetical protein [Symploca sp. SIO2G7]